jgi:hypothetical protein
LRLDSYTNLICTFFFCKRQRADIFCYSFFSEDIVELLETAAELNWDLEIVNKKMTMR